jgi:cytochrome c oxidase subunit 4
MTDTRHTRARTYVVTWVALVLLAAATFGLSRLDLGAWNLPVALAIAVVKGLLVVAIFMHLLEHGTASRLFFAVAIGFIVLLVALTTLDITTRDVTQLPVAAMPGHHAPP